MGLGFLISFAAKVPADVNPILGSSLMLIAIAFYWYLGRKLFDEVFVKMSAKTMKIFRFMERTFVTIWVFLACLGVIRGLYLLMA